jgi:hypothetical protein
MQDHIKIGGVEGSRVQLLLQMEEVDLAVV